LRKSKAPRPNHRDGDGARTDQNLLGRQKIGNAKPQRNKVQEAIAKAPPTATVYLCPTVSDAASVARLGFTAVSIADVDVKHLKDRHVVIIDPNKQDASQKTAKALDGSAASTKIIDLDGTDVGSWIVNDPAGSRLVIATKEAPLFVPAAEAGRSGKAEPPASTGKSDEEMIAEAAALGLLDYARRRRPLAKLLGISVIELDRLVGKARKERAEKAFVLYDHWRVDAHPEPVDGNALVGETIKLLRRYVIFTEDQATVVALWIILTYLHEDIATHSPLLLVTSPQPDSGKTTLLKIVGFLVRRGVSSVSITGPALFRSIEKWSPTIILEEADTAFINNNDLKEVVNGGWTRGETVIRCDGETNEPRPFSIFCPKGIGMIGRKLPPATLSRTIIIAMQRKRPNEVTDDFDFIDNDIFSRLRSQIARFVSDNIEVLAKAKPAVPPAFHNRKRANWKLLLGIADQTGYGEAARKAALEIEDMAAAAAPALAVQLLSDIRDTFNRLGTDRVTTKTLIAELASDQEGPWLSYGKSGKPITDRQLAHLLRDFRRGYGIRSKNLRLDGVSVQRGYFRSDFEDDFIAYLSETAFPAATPLQANEVKDLDPNFVRYSDLDVADKNDAKPLENKSCSGVADKSAVFAQGEGFGVRCAQCNGDPDGTERPHLIDGKTVLLHDICARFFFKGRQT
jgi:putative DNA primase/helicase